MLDYKADAVLVVGDVNSTIACALVAVKNHVPVIHVEAGLRSGDRQMPEEINRVLTDQISDLLYTTERNAELNLNREGINSDKVRFVGNVMIDTLKKQLSDAVPAETTLARLGFDAAQSEGQYGLLTMHRPSNVDDAETLGKLLTLLSEISHRLPIIFPVHPRTKARIDEFGFGHILKQAHIIQAEPLGYMENLGLMASAKVVLTDSGGIQEETTALGVPCITLRENTERPITAEQGTNTIVGRDTAKIMAAFNEVMSGGGKQGRQPELWDGQAAVRIAQDMESWFQRRLD